MEDAMLAVETEITVLSQQRQDIWAGRATGEVSVISERLAELFKLRRHSVAKVPEHAEVLRRARTETELEKLAKR